MYEFFSCISDGQGKVLSFTLVDVVEIMAKFNKEEYDFNSHTSVADYYGIKPLDKDKWNKWEYNPDTKFLRNDVLNASDDRVAVEKYCRKFFRGKNVDYVKDLFCCNSGDCNFGDCNSGDCNSGNGNSGYCNSGDGNSGYYNSGDCNSGNGNSGYYNSGGYNSGECNSGNCNSGYCNSGDYNSGDYNSGNRNSGLFNTTEPKARFFNQLTDKTLSELYDNNSIPQIGLPLTEFIPSPKMTRTEKKNNPNHNVIGGFLRVLDYKKAWNKYWKSTTSSNRKKIKNLPNFNAKIFKEITGIKI